MNSKSRLYRLDKHTGRIIEFDNGERAVDQFMVDFDIRTRNTARSNLFALLTDIDTKFWQNTGIAWSYSRELVEK